MAARNLILNNFWWKFLSLVLAGLVWLTIQTILHRNQVESAQSPVVTTHYRTFSDVPVTLMTSPYNTNLFRIHPLTVSVEVHGKVEDLNELQLKDITAYVDTSTYDGKLQPDIQVRVPPKFKIARVIPGWATLERIAPDKIISQPPGHLP